MQGEYIHRETQQFQKGKEGMNAQKKHEYAGPE